MFFKGVDARNAELVGEISSILDGYRRAHAPSHPQIDAWTWLVEELGDRWQRGFQTRFAVPGTADAVGEVLAAICERFPEIEIYGRIDTPSSLTVDGQDGDGLGTEVQALLLVAGGIPVDRMERGRGSGMHRCVRILCR